MNKTINIADKKSIQKLEDFKLKKYTKLDIKFTNVHLKKVNNLVNQSLISKNDVFINSETLWEIMQPPGNNGKHNYHGLLPEEINEVINALKDPIAIIKAKLGRFMFFPVITTSGKSVVVILEVGASLDNQQNANINKIITIYPKDDIESYIDKRGQDEILYKKMSINAGSNCHC